LRSGGPDYEAAVVRRRRIRPSRWLPLRPSLQGNRLTASNPPNR
jgi:hypothetical protein